MNFTLVQLLASICAGISAGCVFRLLLERFTGGRKAKPQEEIVRQLPLLFRLALPLTPLTRGFAAGKSCKTWSEMSSVKLWMAGYGEQLSAVDFLAIRLVFFLWAMLSVVLGVLSQQIGICFFVALLLIVYPSVWLSLSIKKRHLAIMKALPNVLDLLTLSVESGRDLLSALRDILARRRMDELGEELMRTFQEIQLGRKRTEALREMANRVRQPDLTATVNAIVQAEELGVSIAHLLRIQGDMQRNKRFSLAEKMANESAVKIIIPVVIFILPAVFIVLLGPLALQAFRTFGGR